ncbi:MAG: twin-arginine translocation signal domain-containing protein, partial [Alphaproteobacteria bacterium]
MQQTPEQIASPSVERRQFLKLAAVTGGLMAVEGSQGLLPRAAAQDASQIQVANPAFRQLYAEQRGYYIQNPAWVRDTVARLTWPAAGTKVPELGVLIPTTQPAWLNAFRKWSRDGGQVGLRYTMQQVSQSRWLEAIVTHMHGDIQFHPAVARPERVDPSEWLISRAYGKDRRNYGEWANEEYDRLIDLQSAESDPTKRLEHVRAAQKVLAEDRYITQLGWGPGVIDPYNAERWEGVVPVTGFGICSFDMFQTYLGLKPRRANQRRRVVVGTLSLVETLNIIQAANRFRSIGRMIYDRLAYLDKDLNVIPWAAERWVRLDELTYDVTLRAGMK